MDKLSELNHKEKKVAAKVLTEAGYSPRKIESLFDIDDVTAWRAAKEATPDELKSFEADFRTAIQEMKRKGITLAQKQLLTLIPKETKIESVVNALKYFENKPDTNIKITPGKVEDMSDKELDDIIEGVEL